MAYPLGCVPHVNQVERHYMFVPLANPMDFPGVHERLMREQSRSRGLTFTYSYKGSEPRKPLSCKLNEMTQEHLLALLTLLAILVVCSHFAHHFYISYYLRKEVLDLIRRNSHYDEGTSLTRGIPTERLFQLLSERLARSGPFRRFLLKDKLTLERVDEVCHELLWSPTAGVRTYRMHETNHWWADGKFAYSLPQGTEGNPSSWTNGGPTVGLSQQSGKTSSYGLLSSMERQWEEVNPQNTERGGRPTEARPRMTSQLLSHWWASGPIPTAAEPCPTTISRPVCEETLRVPSLHEQTLRNPVALHHGKAGTMREAYGKACRLGFGAVYCRHRRRPTGVRQKAHHRHEQDWTTTRGLCGNFSKLGTPSPANWKDHLNSKGVTCET